MTGETGMSLVRGRIEAAPRSASTLTRGLTQAIDLTDWRAAMQSTEPEIWKPVFGFEGLYEVSSQGRIRRSPSARGRGARPGHVLSPNSNGRGNHQWVTLYCQGFGTKVYIHRAVATAFLPPSAAPVVRHLDDDPLNNHVWNLAWGTQADNVRDMVVAGRAKGGRPDVSECPYGHAYSTENTRISTRGSRHCRTCERDRSRRNYHQRRAS